MHDIEPILDDVDYITLAKYGLFKGGGHGFDQLHKNMINGSSLPTLLRVGFNLRRAGILWHEWLNWPKDSPVQIPFYDFVLGHACPYDVKDVHGDNNPDA
ncbi:hypothetical protein Sste5346_007770 [Sporothrix stenoceras]|uniref:Uncharacterized protein n=1 Tax=Sporothrix stenoceras TaxID=5173 RepID=A0ABR3YSH9_9PEZI